MDTASIKLVEHKKIIVDSSLAEKRLTVNQQGSKYCININIFDMHIITDVILENVPFLLQLFECSPMIQKVVKGTLLSSAQMYQYATLMSLIIKRIPAPYKAKAG